MNNELAFYRMKHLESVTGFSRITIWGWIKQGAFPEGTKIGGRIRVWPREEIEAFMRGNWGTERNAA